MKSKEDNPGVHIPPPLLFIGTFLLALLIQKFVPFSKTFLRSNTSKLVGVGFLLLGTAITIPALGQFIRSRNTVVTIKPARSL